MPPPDGTEASRAAERPVGPNAGASSGTHRRAGPGADPSRLPPKEQAAFVLRDFAPEAVLVVSRRHGELARCLGATHVGIDADPASGPDLEAVTPTTFDVVLLEGLEWLAPAAGDALVAEICRRTRQILLDAAPYAYGEPTVLNPAPPEHWARLLGRMGFFRDVDDDPVYISRTAVRYRRGHADLSEVAASYERRHWQLRREAEVRRGLNLESREEVAGVRDRLRTAEAQALRIPVLERQVLTARAERDEMAARAAEFEEQALAWYARWTELEGSFGWGLLQRLQGLRGAVAPPGSIRDQTAEEVLRGLLGRDPGRILRALRRARDHAAMLSRRRASARRRSVRVAGRHGLLTVVPVPPRPPVGRHEVPCDVIVPIHNALDDVRRCLGAVEKHTSQPYNLILIDDGSDADTRDFLTEWSRGRDVELIRNEEAHGYTVVANQALAASKAPCCVLLNSDTEVTPDWLDGLLACADSDPRIGLAGPLSNTASWQSVPRLAEDGDWAANPLPEGVSVQQLAEELTVHAARTYPRLPILNGFCLLVRREVVESVGTFDEETFPTGYGEENDFCLRAGEAGWQLAVADDVYVYHAMGRSYTDARRKALTAQANDTLAAKHSQAKVDVAVAELANNRVIEGIRSHAGVLADQRNFVALGKERFAGKRVLFLLPAAGAGGGAVTVAFTTRVMDRMGVEAAIFNIPENRDAFEAGFPGLETPVVYGRDHEVLEAAREYDAVVATAHHTVRWMLPAYAELPELVRGYLIQDFEAYFYREGSTGRMAAQNSYGLVPDIVRVATTAWVQREVERMTGLECARCGGAVDVDLFRPRPRTTPDWPERPVRVAAMVRPESAYRSPGTTMRVLGAIADEFGDAVEILIYGTSAGNPGFAALPRDFRFQLLGKLSQREMAFLFNEVDVFADFSLYQAYGMAAVEAMNCGVATIVPEAGGTDTYAKNGVNCVAVDTRDEGACLAALRRLVADDDFRRSVQVQALWTGATQHPEAPTYRLLAALFGEA